MRRPVRGLEVGHLQEEELIPADSWTGPGVVRYHGPSRGLNWYRVGLRVDLERDCRERTTNAADKSTVSNDASNG